MGGGREQLPAPGGPQSAQLSPHPQHRGGLEKQGGWEETGLLTRGLAHSDLALALEQGGGGRGCQLFTGGSFGGEVRGW